MSNDKKTYTELLETLKKCDRDAAKEALEDGEYLAQFDVTQEQVDALYEVFDLDEVLTDRKLEAMASLMNDDIREAVHSALAPCTNDDFLAEYLKLDPGFRPIVEEEFGIKNI